MLTPWVLKVLRDALMEQAAKTEDAQTLQTDSLNQYRDEVTLVDALTQDSTWYPFSILEFTPGIARVVRSASVGNKTVSYKTPLWPGIGLPATVSVRRGHLAGAKVSVGGGDGEHYQGAVSLHLGNYPEDPRAINRDQFGSFAEVPGGLAIVTYSIPNTGMNEETYETSYWEWLYLVEQVRAIISSEDALPQGCRRVMLRNTTLSQYHEAQQWTLRGDIDWYLDMRV